LILHFGSSIPPNSQKCLECIFQLHIDGINAFLSTTFRFTYWLYIKTRYMEILHSMICFRSFTWLLIWCTEHSWLSLPGDLVQDFFQNQGFYQQEILSTNVTTLLIRGFDFQKRANAFQRSYIFYIYSWFYQSRSGEGGGLDTSMCIRMNDVVTRFPCALDKK